MDEFKTIANFLAYLACLAAICAAAGYGLDLLFARFKWWRLR